MSLAILRWVIYTYSILQSSFVPKLSVGGAHQELGYKANYRLTNGISEMLQVRKLLVVSTLFHTCTHQLRLMVTSLMLLFQLLVPGGGRREGGREGRRKEGREGGKGGKKGGREWREGRRVTRMEGGVTSSLSTL